ncbi:hypothetical protein FRC07_004168 [Ceratobasidium sp. 392]|nr:hypothetical protein FRC07_004168 [Ceratobasidium sp. 392]
MSIDPNKAQSAANNSSRTFGTAFVTNIALLDTEEWTGRVPIYSLPTTYDLDIWIVHFDIMADPLAS